MSDEKLFAGIYVDADLTPRIVTALRQRSYECQSALEDGMRDATDQEILERATDLDMVLLTNNAEHFAQLAKQWATKGRQHSGILISAVSPATDRRVSALAATLPGYGHG